MKLALLGDIGLFGRFSLLNGFDPEEYFSDFIVATKDCDVIIGNLEIPFSQERKEFKAKSATIFADKINIDTLKSLNVNYVNLANNHLGDFGKEGYELTKNTLESNGIKYFGVEGIVTKIEDYGNKICLSGFCNMDSNPVYLAGIDDKDGLGVNVADCDDIIDTLESGDSNGYLNIMAFHSGLEHVNLPGKADILFARYLADNYNYVLYGHHPHAVQAFEMYNGSHLFYSLGNFCFDDIYIGNSKTPFVTMEENNKIGLVPILTITNSVVTDVEYIWTYLGVDKMHLLQPDDNKIIRDVCNIEINNLEEVELSRNKLISSHLERRKSSRTIYWYLKRLRFKYLMLIINSKRNAKIYESRYLSKLKNKKILS